MLSSTPTQCCRAVRVARPRSLCVVAASAVERAPTSLQFVKGVVETAVPSVKLTRARDGSSGTAIFYFEQPDVFEASDVPGSGDITGLYLVDEEGTLSTVDVSAKFVNGKPKGIEAKYVMRSAFEWERFMRFMVRQSRRATRQHHPLRGEGRARKARLVLRALAGTNSSRVLSTAVRGVNTLLWLKPIISLLTSVGLQERYSEEAGMGFTGAAKQK